MQVVHVDDLASALALVATRDLPGAYNVAADGWLDADEARALIGRPAAPALPAEVLERWLRRTWDLGMGDVPAGVVPYLVHPWVIGNERLRAAGWVPSAQQRRRHRRGGRVAAASRREAGDRRRCRWSAARGRHRGRAAPPPSPRALRLIHCTVDNAQRVRPCNEIGGRVHADGCDHS